jgi:hypothetical protein
VVFVPFDEVLAILIAEKAIAFFAQLATHP